MLIKINSDESLDSELDYLKSRFDVGSASKAVSIAAVAYQENVNTIAEQSRKIDKLESKLNGIVSLLAEKQELEMHINKFVSDETTLY